MGLIGPPENTPVLESSRPFRHTAGGSARTVLLPFAIACAAAATFVVLLVRHGFRSDEIEKEVAPSEAGLSEESRLPVPLDEYPVGSPTDPSPEPLPRYDGEFPRWNLVQFPEGWDPALAKSIHAYFEAMTPDYKDVDRMLQIPGLREEFRELLAKLGPEALPTLAAILNAEGDFVNRRFLLYAIGGLGPRSEKATFILRDFYMARAGDPRNGSEIRHVIQAMGLLGNETSFQVLQDMIGAPPEAGVVEEHKRLLVEALGEHPRREDAVPLFVDHMLGDDSKHMRNMSAQALGKVRSPETLSELYRAAETEGYYVVKQTILGSIGKIGNPNSIAFLESQYRQALAPTPEGAAKGKQEAFGVRLSAARAISRIGTPYAVEVLRELQRSEPEAKAREYIDTWIAETEANASERTPVDTEGDSR